MSKLTPPAIQNSKRRKEFFKDKLKQDPENVNAIANLERLEKESTYQAIKRMLKQFKIKNSIAKGKFYTKPSGAFGKPMTYKQKKVKLEVI